MTDGSDCLIYAERRQRPLRLHVRVPGPDHRFAGPRPGLLLLHGGGWEGGDPSELAYYAEHFAGLGYVAAAAEYRLAWIDGTTPFDAADDARAALAAFADGMGGRWPVDRDRIAVLGVSAGGHLAFWAARDAAPDRRPAALVLLGAVLDTAPADGFGLHILGDRWPEASPLLHLTPELPPTLVIHATDDEVVPVAGARRFAEALRAAGVETRCRWLHRAGHGFFVLPHQFADPPRLLGEIGRFLDHALGQP